MNIKCIKFPVEVPDRFRIQTHQQAHPISFTHITHNEQFSQNAFLPDHHRHHPSRHSHGPAQPGRQLRRGASGREYIPDSNIANVQLG